jgi:hypothetical protein
MIHGRRLSLSVEWKAPELRERRTVVTTALLPSGANVTARVRCGSVASFSGGWLPSANAHQTSRFAGDLTKASRLLSGVHAGGDAEAT